MQFWDKRFSTCVIVKIARIIASRFSQRQYHTRKMFKQCSRPKKRKRGKSVVFHLGVTKYSSTPGAMFPPRNISFLRSLTGLIFLLQRTYNNDIAILFQTPIEARCNKILLWKKRNSLLWSHYYFLTSNSEKKTQREALTGTWKLSPICQQRLREIPDHLSF